MTRTEWLVDYILGPCNCSEGYTSRGLTSPHCSRCTDGDEAREALLLAYQLGWDDARVLRGGEVVESNREALAALAKQMEAERFE